MKYLIRDGLVEFKGTKKECIQYIQDAYEYDYFVNEYWDQLEKNFEKLNYVLKGLGLTFASNPPKSRKRY